MRKILATIFSVLFVFCAVAQKVSSVYVDRKGVMRWSDSHREASFFGVNYTLPFAHAYRAAGYLGVDRKKAIDEDVYHFARLGFNAYRIHIWDVEVSDGEGNLLENDHLDLLDYLIAKLKERNIHLVLTAQTNFGNGYPERNQPTGGFSYKYDKCDIHSNPEAIAAQERYIAGLVKHVNPYTGKAYKDDPIVVGFEINNEPCHSGTKEQVRDYINGMLAAMKDAGSSKPVFYNVSHNAYVVEAYYETDIQGTTYQWYPTGLVSGHTQKGNFLPNVAEYPIPFSNVKGFKNKAKLVYEFDPADLLYSYMYPATVRSFRTAGFQWMTQFAYDPMELAAYNTEYQTHYLNLAYTPGKAISMKIAAEAARTLPLRQSYGTYPADTLFGDFRVSYKEDLSELNSPTKFYYSNSTTTKPVSPNSLTAVSGVGRSPLVNYEGTGAYFLDQLEDGLWRLELMPDAVQASDPFAKPSLRKEVMRIYWGAWNMSLNLPDLGKSFSIKQLDSNKIRNTQTTNGTINQLEPGVYLLQRDGVKAVKEWDATTTWNEIKLGEFVAPKPSSVNFTVRHQAAKITEAGKPLTIAAVVAGNQFPDSVLIYTDQVSFWSSDNPYYKLKRVNGYTYQVEVPGEDVHGARFNYNIVVFSDGQKQTYPANVARSPLDWDYTADQFYRTRVVEAQKPIELFSVKEDGDGLQAYMLPEWASLQRRMVEHSPIEKITERFSFKSDKEQPELYLRKYIADDVANRKERLAAASSLCIQVNDAPAGLKAGFVTADGFTYRTDCPAAENGVVRIALKDLQQGRTALLPIAYPVFMKPYFSPEIDLPFPVESIEFLELMVAGEKGKTSELEIGSIWIE
ncbi:hypothetical protein [Mangrovibacterium marinum]|uniref:Cellulase (Glycosyl hydrolase family 5) n=1 Tax=Mangrovibacterium marinum TaxID=1639118 RepID=A0A2T5C6P3_9BACT|nr:hypothetical protein [Mangrovibacterium marinum]PTN10623.1 hypothetical protein C8N47_101273 [Mangrovibacterium marinum]